MLHLVLFLRSGKVVFQETAAAAGKSAPTAASVSRIAVRLRIVLVVLVVMMLLLLRHLLKGWVVEGCGAGASSGRSVGAPHVFHQNSR